MKLLFLTLSKSLELSSLEISSALLLFPVGGGLHDNLLITLLAGDTLRCFLLELGVR